MSRIITPPYLFAQMGLALYGTSKFGFAGPLDRKLLEAAFNKLSDDPQSGRRHTVDGLEVWTLHLRQLGQPARYQFLYRMVGCVPEVGHLLHDDMPLEHYIPWEWRIAAPRIA